MDVVGDLGTFGARDPIVAIRPSVAQSSIAPIFCLVSIRGEANDYFPHCSCSNLQAAQTVITQGS